MCRKDTARVAAIRDDALELMLADRFSERRPVVESLWHLHCGPASSCRRAFDLRRAAFLTRRCSWRARSGSRARCVEARAGSLLVTAGRP
jgi:hypothetical protein